NKVRVPVCRDARVNEQMGAPVEIDQTIAVEIKSLRAFNIRKLVGNVDPGFHRNVGEVSGSIVDQKVGLRGIGAARRRLRSKGVVGEKRVEEAIVVEIGYHDGFAASP